MSSAPVRASLQSLISFVRDLVGEGDVDSSQISDNQVQSSLDGTREPVRYERAYPQLSILPGGMVEYRVFETEPYLDDAVQALYSDYSVIATSNFDEFDSIGGRFTLKTSISTGIYLVGYRYDPYQAAADLLESMAAKQKGAVDFSEVGLSIKSSQTAPQMLALAKEYRRKARVRSFEFGRSDIR